MDTTRTHDGEIIKGQQWAFWIGDPQTGYQSIPYTVVHITEKGYVVLESVRYMMGTKVPIDTFRRDWFCVQPVELKEYRQFGKRYAIQVFVIEVYGSTAHKRVYGELKL